MIRGFKKIIILILIMMTIFTLFGTVAYAYQSGVTTIDEKLTDEINKTNDYIFKKIDKAKENADKIVSIFSSKIDEQLKKMEEVDNIDNDNSSQVEQANIQQRIESLQRELDNKIDKICEDLIEKTDKKVENLIRKADRSGIVIEKIYMEVTLYNRTILVDPCCAH